jgi:hypothetical protein
MLSSSEDENEVVQCCRPLRKEISEGTGSLQKLEQDKYRYFTFIFPIKERENKGGVPGEG